MDVKDAQEAAKAAGQEEMEKEKQLKEARSTAKGDERPAKWVFLVASTAALSWSFVQISLGVAGVCTRDQGAGRQA